MTSPREGQDARAGGLRDTPAVPSAGPPASPLAAVFLVAFSLLAFELALFRVLALACWTHQAQLVLAGAMLGTGAGGTILAMRPRAWLARAERALAVLPALYALVLVAAYRLALALPFNVLELVWNPREILHLLALHLTLALPFLAGSLYLGLAFMARPGREHATYGANLFGAGAGAVAATAAQVWLAPERLVAVAALTGAAGAVVAGCGSWRRRGAASLIPLVAILLLAGAAGVGSLRPRAGLEVKLSPYKAESQALLVPGTRVVAERNGLLGRWHAVAGPSVHYAPGLSLRSPKDYAMPEQIALFVDGEPAGAATRAALPYPLGLEGLGGSATRRFLLELPTALPNWIGLSYRVFVAGFGGGLHVLEPIFWRAQAQIEVAEPDANAIRIVERLPWHHPGPLTKDGRVSILQTSPRLALERGGKPYDIIMIAYQEGAGASGAGVFAARENYLMTVEGMRLALGRLKPQGILAVANWVVLPPRDGLRALATVSEALGMPPEKAAEHLLLVRTWNTTLLMASPRPFTVPQVERARDWCEERGFDVEFYAGIAPDEPNRVNQLAEPLYYQGATALLGPERADYLAHYPFDLSPPTDDRPYFSHFLRWRTLPALWREMGRDFIPYLEGGYVLLVGGLAEGLVAGALLLALPLVGARGRERASRTPAAPAAGAEPRDAARPDRGFGRGRVLAYFTLLGLGFMLLELVAMAKIGLLMGNSGVAAALTVSGFLIFSGVGCVAGARFERAGRDLLPAAGVFILAAALLFPWSVDLAARWASGWPLLGRALAALALMAPLSLPLGLFFPAGLGRLEARRPQLVPWAWSVNGFASTAGSLLGALLPLSLGFRVTLALAGAAYLAAGLARPRPGWARPDLPRPGWAPPPKAAGRAG